MNKKQLQVFLCVLVFVAQPFPAFAGQTSDAGKPGAQPATAEREGQHDFDFEYGSWKIHLKRLVNPLTGSTKWVEFDGTSVTRKVWDGRAQLEEFETDSAAGGHIEGLTLVCIIRKPASGASIGPPARAVPSTRRRSANSKTGAANSMPRTR